MKCMKWINHHRRICALMLLGLPFAASAQTTTNVLPLSPQFGIYASAVPANYAPPSGVVVLLGNQTWYTLTKLSAAQKQALGSDLKARVNYSAGCDSYDRIESVVYLTKSAGVQPTTADLPNAIEMARFMSSFNYYDQVAPTYVYPLMDVSSFAPFLTSTSQDVWVGIAGGSNPTFPPSEGYQLCWNSNNQASTNIPLTTFPSNVTEAQAPYVGFSFGLGFVSSQTAGTPASGTAVLAALSAATVPSSGPTLSIAGTLNVPSPGNGATTVTGTLKVIVTSHGTDSEYGYNTGNTLLINGTQVGGSFSTQADCAVFTSSSINPLNTSLEGNTTGSNPSNPRNWCPATPVRTTAANPGTPNPTTGSPGTPIQTQTFSNVSLNVGSNTVALNMGPFKTAFGGAYNASNGDYYPTSIVFVPNGTSGSGTGGTPTASFGYATSGLTVNFTDSSTDAGGTITSHSWSFGDGSTSTTTSPSHAYAAAGTYSVTETVTDGGSGKSNATTQSVSLAGSTTTTVNDNASGITYSSGFAASTGRGLGDYDNDVHYTTSNNASASYTFTGTGIDFITETYSDEGNVAIYIDGSLVKTVSTSSSTRKAQQAVYSQTWTSAGSHTIKVVKQSGTYMLVDAFRVHS